MTSIIISSDDAAQALEMGERLAKALDYELLGPSLLAQAAERYSVPLGKLERVLDPRGASRFSAERRALLLAYLETVTLEALEQDGAVCYGLGAHLFVREVSHILTVRLLADPARRARELSAERGITDIKATKLLRQEKERRMQWSLQNFDVDETDAIACDMVISLAKIDVDTAVGLVRDAAGSVKFKPMTYSRQCLHDLTLAATATVELLSQGLEVKVYADGETLVVHLRCPKRHKDRLTRQIKETAGALPGVSLVEVHAVTGIRRLRPGLRWRPVNSTMTAAGGRGW